MKLNLILLLSCILSLSACAFKKDEGEKPQNKSTENVDVIGQIKTEKAKEASNGQLNEENVQVTFAEGEMGFYEMTISWPEDIAKVQVVVNANKEIVSGSNQVKLGVVQGASQAIELTAFDSFGSPVSVYAAVKAAPVDIIIKQPMYLSEDANLVANRLFLLANSFIQTNGNHLNVAVKSLIVEEPTRMDRELFQSYASIRTQSFRNTGVDQFQFRNSSITITAKKAVGTLRVAMIGFNGRNGRSGDELERNLGIARVRNTQLDGANGADESVKKTPKTPDSPAQMTCVRAAGDGQDGKPGAAGMSGEDGQNGGDTGNLVVTIDDFSQFALEVGTMVGIGGKGAIGSKGHEGGNGGAPGKTFQVCAQKPQAGKKGATGPDGANGKDGVSGKIGTISSNVSKQRIFGL